ncbi:NAD(P)-dependent oxidoreductase [Roseomonas nepalensis]|uniref:NAD(P)-dependent oxidoreductase n=1 Tax=Muricoccus nepalensis TaxID=1854500 RepID=A0A502FLI8_9PROT|nr:NAD(P)-dependent oxidoreductase [Roseomonas nepalensis]TPG49933.1 NAD(P)-dependent oxidoreductase [Roseomonas nepalensis]
MRILITGNMGYVGPVLVRHLRQRFPDATLLGFDSGLFAHCLTMPAGTGPVPETLLDAQHFGDVRNVPDAVFEGVDAVVHLAAVSNDPMGNRFEAVTEAINQEASLRVAEQAHRAGVRAFVFASSCSVYGFAEGGARRETDAVNPLTAYARSKIGTEEGLRQRDLPGMAVTCLRFATACGMSDRLRLDLVLNDFVAGALGSGTVSVLSDGTPWRPLIDVRDMARAIEWAIQRRPEDEGGPFLVVNAGSDERNHTVRELAEAVAGAIPGTEVSINKDAPPDKRSYQVDFSLFRKLAPEHQPQETLDRSIAGLLAGLRGMGFADPNFRESPFIRLKTLAALLESGRLGTDLTWVPDRAA